MALYFDSNAGSNGSGATAGTPKNTFDGIGSGLITEANCNIYIKAGSSFNLQNSITNLNGYTNNKITIERYGSGANPLLYSSQVGLLSTWQEVSLASIQPNSGAVVAQPGSHLWHRAITFDSMLLGDAGTKANPGTNWGQLRGYTVDGSPDTYQGTFPTTDYHFCKVIVGGVAGTVIWSNGHPASAYYGVTYSQTLGAIFSISQPRGGFECYGIDFGHSTQYSIDISFGTYERLCAPIIISECNLDHTLGMRIGSGVTNRTNNTGTTGLIIEKSYAKNIGNSFIGTWGNGYNASHVFNNTHIRSNVIDGVCKRYSLGGIYLLNCRTNDGSRIKVYDNTVSGAMRDNSWPDGYAIYQDFSVRDVDIYRNYVWDSDLAFRNNGCDGNIRIAGNVAVAKASAAADSSAFGSNDPNSVNLPANIELAYNVAVGFNRFAGYQNIVSGSRFNLHHNVSIAKSGGSGTQHAVDVRGPTGMTLDRNNFYGYAGNHWHDYDAFDGAAGDISSQATNKITSNPTSALAPILLTPTDPTVNYALTLPKMDDWTTTPAYTSAPCINPT